MIRVIEFLGTLAGILGAFLVACKMPEMGYPFFLISSICLTYSAVRQRQWNLMALQGVFLLANILGLVNYL